MASSHFPLNSDSILSGYAKSMMAKGWLYKIDISLPIQAQLKSIDPGHFNFVVPRGSNFLYLHYSNHNEILKHFNLYKHAIEMAGELIYNFKGQIIYFNFKTESVFEALQLANPEVSAARKQTMCDKFNIDSDAFFSLNEATFLKQFFPKYFNVAGYCTPKISQDSTSILMSADFFAQEEDFRERAGKLFFQLELNQLYLQENASSIQDPRSRFGEFKTSNSSSAPHPAPVGAQAAPAAAVLSQPSDSLRSPLAQTMINIGMLYKIDTSLPIQAQVKFLDPGRYSFAVLRNSPILFLHLISHNEVVNNFNLDSNKIEIAGELIYSPEGKIIYFNFKTGGFYQQLQLENPVICEQLKLEMCKRFDIMPGAFFSIDEVQFLDKLLNKYIDVNSRIIFTEQSNPSSDAAVDDDFYERGEEFAERAQNLLFQLKKSQHILRERIATTQGPYSRRMEITGVRAVPPAHTPTLFAPQSKIAPLSSSLDPHAAKASDFAVAKPSNP